MKQATRQRSGGSIPFAKAKVDTNAPAPILNFVRSLTLNLNKFLY
ncbi:MULTISPECIES: hypothetical protein [unclassified Nostoc]|nr:hypothetical protein [Nostoc sp. DedQUE03]MDZ7974010.1 hypothetical protein [Nostoc sp. DedQUE03]MDZ8045792.1 hypothetical protein [Nostoc sp. DedQUE02]